jgi:hypothetical protein
VVAIFQALQVDCWMTIASWRNVRRKVVAHVYIMKIGLSCNTVDGDSGIERVPDQVVKGDT